MKRLSLERRPWALAAIAAIGITLLLSSAFALLAPPELLDAAVALGDRRLALALAALFLVSGGLVRLLLVRRRSQEEDLERAEEPHPPPVQRETHLR